MYKWRPCWQSLFHLKSSLLLKNEVRSISYKITSDNKDCLGSCGYGQIIFIASQYWGPKRFLDLRLPRHIENRIIIAQWIIIITLQCENWPLRSFAHLQGLKTAGQFLPCNLLGIVFIIHRMGSERYKP